jgi:hypothetical protein
MANIGVVEGVKLFMYANDHPPPHFHALFAEYRAVIDIQSMSVNRRLASSQVESCSEMGCPAPERVDECLVADKETFTGGANRMKKALRIVMAEPVIHGVLKVVFTDGYEGVVDLRPLIAHGRIFTWLHKPENFRKIQLEEYGHHVFWLNDKGQTIDLGADGLRRDAEKQAELHKMIAS